jgi:dimethylamine monooxygenase subunit C
VVQAGRRGPIGPLSADRAPRPEHVPLGQTTLPRYRPPVLDPAPHLVVGATDLARPHDRVLPPGADLATELSRLVTGWRVLAVGPERDVQAVRAVALATGALDEEIVLVPTDLDPADDLVGTRVRRLFCGACHHRFDARVAVGDPVACPACRAALGVTEHHSRRHAAFLAVPSGHEVPG